MFEKIVGKNVEIYVGSYSGSGVAVHGGLSIVNSVIIIDGTVSDYNDKFIYLTNTSTTILSQQSIYNAFSKDKSLQNISSEKTLISIDKILFINY